MLIFYSASRPADDPSFWPDYWRNQADNVDRFMPEYRVFRRYVASGAVVLDAGCGSGFATRAMLRQGYRAFGIDFDQCSVTRFAKEQGYFPASAADVTALTSLSLL